MRHHLRQLLQLTARGVASVGADSLHEFSLGERPAGHLSQQRIVCLVVHDGDYKNLVARTRSRLRKLALKAVNGLCRRSGWLLYRQSASCWRARATASEIDQWGRLFDKWVAP
jgi:hypothetical protein